MSLIFLLLSPLFTLLAISLYNQPLLTNKQPSPLFTCLNDLAIFSDKQNFSLFDCLDDQTIFFDNQYFTLLVSLTNQPTKFQPSSTCRPLACVNIIQLPSSFPLVPYVLISPPIFFLCIPSRNFNNIVDSFFRPSCILLPLLSSPFSTGWKSVIDA